MMGFCWAIGVWGSSVLRVEVLYECFSKALMTSQAAILQLGEVLDDSVAIGTFSGFAHSPCSFVGVLVQFFEQF